MLMLALFRYANPGRVAGVQLQRRTLLISCGTRLSSLGDDHRTGFIPNTSVGLLKLLEPLDTSPQRQPRDRHPHHKSQYRNL
jgi:hypothetical protein